MLKRFLVIVLLQNFVNAFETYQLPLSDQLLKSFPKLHVSHLIIINTQLKIVVHEVNSKSILRCGTFSDAIFASALYYKFGKRLKKLVRSELANLNKIKQHKIIDKFLMKNCTLLPQVTDISSYSDGELITLYDMCKIFTTYFDFLSKQDGFINQNSFMFNSAKYNGIAFKFTNSHNCEFICILFTTQSVITQSASKRNISKHNMLKYNVSKHDISILKYKNLICKWLEQFEIRTLNCRTKLFTRIPVFYGTVNSLNVNLQTKDKILTLANKQEKVLRTIRYVMRLRAPLKINDQIGWIFYRTSVFSNPIKRNILASCNISTCSGIKKILDSISFVIYNKPF